VLIRAWPIVIANMITFVLAAGILAMKVAIDRRRRGRSREVSAGPR
jgi:uncharacterized protein with PQ loop repeat